MKTKKSQDLFEKSKHHIAGGVNSPVRAFKSVGGTPIFFKKSRGCYLYDEDGNKYLDFVGSWGPMVLGHSNKNIVSAIKSQASKGISFGAPTKNELEIAKIIKSYLPSIEKLRMVNSGTEATMSCIRLARGTTNKKKIIKFIGCYHGHVDSLLVKAGSGLATLGVPDSPGIPEELSQLTISLPYNDIPALDKAFKEYGNDIAAVIIEPIAGNMGFIEPDINFLKELRNLCTKNKTILIFDEVMTGFGRTGKMFATDHLTMKPDIICLAKSLTGGFIPLAATVFSEEIHKVFVDTNFNKTFLHGHSFSANPVACAAALSSLNLFNEDKTFTKIEEISKIHNDCLKKISKLQNISKIRKLGTIAAFDFKNISDSYGSLESLEMRKKFLENGLLLRPLGNTVYFMPPYCIKKENLINSYEKLIEILQ